MKVRRVLRGVVPNTLIMYGHYLNSLWRARRESGGRGPISLNLFAVDRCNLRCRMCPNHRQERVPDSSLLHAPTADMSEELLLQAIRLFPTVRRACFAGVGEPMLVENLFRMIDGAAAKGVECGLVSNGVLHTHEWHVDSLLAVIRAEMEERLHGH